MKIVKLTASNIKRLHAIEITPEGSTVIIGGKNAQGKSSVIDSISYALGGQKLIPSEPIRKGESAAEVEVDLGEIIVTRKFRRDPLTCDCGANYPKTVKTEDLKKVVDEGVIHKKSCASNKFGETRSSLLVRTKEGLQYPSPQAVLDKLLGQLTFDPLAFVKAKSAEQVETLRRVVNLDTRELDKEHHDVYTERTVLNRQLNAETVKLGEMPIHAQEGFKTVSIDEITTELESAKKARDFYDSLVAETNRISASADSYTSRQKERQSRIDELRKELESIESAQKKELKTLVELQSTLKLIVENRDKAQNAIPDMNGIIERMSEVTTKNERINHNIQRKEQQARVDGFKKRVEKYTDTLAEIDATKKKLIESVKYPVNGLGFDFEKDEVSFNGLPFNQASTAEQIRVSVAIGLAINPTLRVLLVKDGSYLDSEGMRMIAEYAEQANAQFWIERVAESKDGAMVMIEDGAVI